MKKTLIIAGVLSLFLFATEGVSAAASSLSAFDTVSDFGTAVSIDSVPSGRSVRLQIEDPTGNTFYVEGESTGPRDFLLEVPAVYVHRTGTYKVAMEDSTSKTTFRVFPAESPEDVGGDSDLLIAQASVAPDHFEIENLPATVDGNQTVSFRVRAVDSADVTLTSYNGTVEFTSSDPSATVPSAYKFTLADQGRKTFDLGLRFATTGTHTFSVFDESDNSIKAQKTVTVRAATRSSASGTVLITHPAPGTYTFNSTTVEGEADPSSAVKVFDNGQQVGEVRAGSDGRFSYTTSLLRDGAHTFVAESNGVQSTAVTITIDSTPAQVEDVQISSREVGPGESFEISIRSDPNLSFIQATIDTTAATLENDPSDPGLYKGVLFAPDRDGTYKINVSLSDNLANPSDPVEVGEVRVRADLGGSNGSTFSDSYVVPSTVESLKGFPGSGRVTLTWDPAEAEAGIAFYRVYYGTNPDDLSSVTNTRDAETSWVVTNLQNGVRYYFQVSGVDTLSNEADNRSEVVAVTPSQNALSDLPDGSDSPVLCDPEPCPVADPPPYTPEDGPAMLLPIVVSLIAGRIIQKRREKIKI